MTHPARAMPFDVLWDGLQKAKAARFVYECTGADGLHLFCYSKFCVYSGGWDELTILARGLILDPVAKRVVATPFPKFFNLGERSGDWPDLPFEVFEKIDGSLIILYHHAGRWRCATKGSFESEQARWAEARLAHLDSLVPGTTYLLEAVYPENRVVVKYGREALVMLGAYDESGRELAHAELPAGFGVWPGRSKAIADRRPFGSISELIRAVKSLKLSEEGFVVRFSNGLRLKVKGDEYLRIHRMLAQVTPLHIWEALRSGADLQAIRRELPEEFWTDFDAIARRLEIRESEVRDAVERVLLPLADLTNKEVGVRLATLEPLARRYAFASRKGEEAVRKQLFEDIRPDGNVLPGYTPTRGLSAIDDE